MTYLYQLAVLGAPTETQIHALREAITVVISKFDLRLGEEVGLEILPATFKPHLLQPSAVVYFAGATVDLTQLQLANLQELLQRGVPVIPVISDPNQAGIPDILKVLPVLDYAKGEAQQLSTALLACIGLLQQHRRVFISYRYDDANAAAYQLYKALSALQFDVYLDTHDLAEAEGKPASDDIAALSWHKLYDSDVLLMLDTPGYFESRWSSAEFGRVLAKGISILRVDWPGATPSRRSSIANVSKLSNEDIDLQSGQIAEAAVTAICAKLEEVRSQNHAVRAVNIFSSIRIAIQKVGGKMLGVSANKAVHLQLPDGERLTVYPTVGVPTPFTLEDAISQAQDETVAVVYDPVGLNQKNVKHLKWLEDATPSAQWIKATEASWQFGHWEH
jgi:hypothetical protein